VIDDAAGDKIDSGFHRAGDGAPRTSNEPGLWMAPSIAARNAFTLFWIGRAVHDRA
jgi:hypothetical protein